MRVKHDICAAPPLPSVLYIARVRILCYSDEICGRAKHVLAQSSKAVMQRSVQFQKPEPIQEQLTKSLPCSCRQRSQSAPGRTEESKRRAPGHGEPRNKSRRGVGVTRGLSHPGVKCGVYLVRCNGSKAKHTTPPTPPNKGN